MSLRQIVKEQLFASRFELSISAACMAAFTAAELATPWPLKIIFDHILLAKPLTPSLFWLRTLLSQGRIRATILLSLSIVVIALLRGAFGYGQSFLTARVGYEMVDRLRRTLFSHLQRLSLSFHSRARTGELLTRVVGDTNALRDVFTESALSFLSQALTVVGIFVTMFALNWRLGLVVAATFPLLIYSILFRYRRIRTSTRRQREREGAVASRIFEVIGELRLVRAYAREKLEQERFELESGYTLEEGIRTARLEAAAARSMEIISSLSTCAVVLFGTLQVLNGSILPGEVLVFTAYLTNLYKPLRSLARISTQFSKAAASAERIGEILEIEPEVPDDDRGLQVNHLAGSIVFDGVSFGYGEGQKILRDVSFSISPGERVALVGASGAGKSTIVSLLLRFYKPASGRILIDGRGIGDYQAESLRKQIGVVLQESILFGASIRENIMYGRTEATDAEIQEAARDAAADEFIDALPEGYETIIGERGSTLSGGQRQRICLARAILKRPSILILDEPTSAVGTESAVLILEAIKNLQRGKTLIMISHHFAGIEDFDRIIVLKEGRVIEMGDHDELIRLNGHYSELYRMQYPRQDRPPLARFELH